jgi:hypothetical protein
LLPIRKIRGLIIVGPLIFGQTTRRIFSFPHLKDGTLAMLQGTETEVNTIESILIQKQIKVSKFIKKEASEDALKTMNNPRILYIVTHDFS